MMRGAETRRFRREVLNAETRERGEKGAALDMRQICKGRGVRQTYGAGIGMGWRVMASRFECRYVVVLGTNSCFLLPFLNSITSMMAWRRWTRCLRVILVWRG
ncbi:hypothetical protein FA13DRAFT_666123 [Coprinellus micaceus]|uniref:Uncharacterized protein n=1 Tax=Coprinellus micaceus TaxID=71717 RepID=A0A4Y7T5G9_COPMI|nr:hypothetical protein FA13DRAFT_666123 [Coprinellus micaceus]